MDRGAWQVTVHRVTKSHTRLKWPSVHAHFWSCCLFFWFWTIWAVCIFWRLSPCRLFHSQIYFSHSECCLFVSLFSFPFWLLFLLLWETDLRKHWYSLCQRIFCLCLLLRLFKKLFVCLFIFWLHEVFIAICGLSSCNKWGYSLLQCMGFSLRWLLL